MATGVPSKQRVRNEIRHSDNAVSRTAGLVDLFEDKISSDNLLIYGDNALVLRELLSSYKNKIDLIYIDPPFGTGFAFETRAQQKAYDDSLVGEGYLSFLRERIELMHDLLSSEGSFYLHLDENMIFHAKLLLDEVFGAKAYRNLIVRKKTNSKNYTRKKYGNVCDYILFYTKTDNYVWNQQYDPYDSKIIEKEYRHVDEKTGRRYMLVPIHAPGVRNGETGKSWRGMTPPPGKHWQYKPSRLDEMDANDEIYWSPNGNPRRKVFLDTRKGASVQDYWDGFKDAHNQNIRITGYPTEKNPDLLKRIISASSNEGGIVLDAFGGSGTVADVATELGRKWISIDNSLHAIDVTVNRLLNGRERMGDYVKKQEAPSQKAFFERKVQFRLLENLSVSAPIDRVLVQDWQNELAS